MSDRDSAYRILGLDSGASIEEIEEAYLDLKTVWHPDRFADRPELHEKAERKLKAVEYAYQLLKDHHAARQLSVSESGPSLARNDGVSGRGPSILDDTLSERMGRPKRMLPVWIALFALVAVAVLISFLTWSPVDVEPDSKISPEEKILADIRADRSADDEPSVEEETSRDEGPEPAQSEIAETEPAKTRVEPSAEPVIPEAPQKPAKPRSSPRVAAPPTPGENQLAAGDLASVSSGAEAGEVQQEAASEVTGPERETAVSELAQRSFQILRAKSDLANQLVEGALAGLNYKDWKAVERSPTEVYVDLIAEVVSESREAHFVWAVDVEAQSVRPMSQAARDLQAVER